MKNCPLIILDTMIPCRKSFKSCVYHVCVFLCVVLNVVLLLINKIREIQFPILGSNSEVDSEITRWIYKWKTKIPCHLNLEGSLWITELSSLAWTWSIALLEAKLRLIYGRINYTAVLHDSLLLQCQTAKTDYTLD